MKYRHLSVLGKLVPPVLPMTIGGSFLLGHLVVGLYEKNVV
jgi:hypothetical protein